VVIFFFGHIEISLAKRGMDHPEKCPLCDQEEENIDHLLLSCVFTRQFWFSFLQQVNLQELAPQLENISFMEWWRRIDEESIGSVQNGLNSLNILGAWTLWKHRNRCVFDGIAPSLAATISQAEEEKRAWELAGAKGITFLVAQLPGN
jgi:hypothetical protein